MYYYNTGLADIAARVTTEFSDSDEFADNGGDTETPCNEDEDDFEFDLSNLTPEDGQIYPLFNRDLLADIDPEEEFKIQLKSLFLEDREPPSSSSSSEAGDLGEIPPGTYCVLALSKSPSPSVSVMLKSAVASCLIVSL